MVSGRAASKGTFEYEVNGLFVLIMTKLAWNERRFEDSGSQGNASEVYWVVWFQNIPFEVSPKPGLVLRNSLLHTPGRRKMSHPQFRAGSEN